MIVRKLRSRTRSRKKKKDETDVSRDVQKLCFNFRLSFESSFPGAVAVTDAVAAAAISWNYLPWTNLFPRLFCLSHMHTHFLPLFLALSVCHYRHLLFQTNFLIYLFFLHLEAKFVVCTSCCRCFRVKRGNWLRLKSKSCLKSLPHFTPPPSFSNFPSSSSLSLSLSSLILSNALKHLKFLTLFSCRGIYF